MQRPSDASSCASRSSKGGDRHAKSLDNTDQPIEVRRALIALIGLGPSTLAPYANKIAELLRADDAGVRYWALKALAELEPDQLAPFVGVLVERLNHSDVAVRHTALGALSKLDHQALAPHALDFLELLADPRGPVRGGAAEAVSKIVPEVLAQYADILVVAYAVESLEKLEPLVLKVASLNLRAVVELFCDVREAVQAGVLRVLLKMDPTRLASILQWRSSDGNTALHYAAWDGSTSLCRRLVQAGALVSVKNHDGRKPVDLAQMNNNLHAVEYLLTCNSFGVMRGGTGDALAVAMEDERPVAKVEWYTIPLLGLGGQAGIVHSLLAVTVSASPDEAQHTYVIEKAAGSGEQFKNGTFVSHWLDVMPLIESSAIYTLESESLAQSGPILMRDLRQQCVDLGAYDVGNCNCHHAAMALYNSCATANSRLTTMPNQLYTWVASFLQVLGVDIANCNSGYSDSGRVAEANQNLSKSIARGCGIDAFGNSHSARAPVHGY